MTSFSASIYEQQNDRRLQELESKVSMLKDITLDIHKQASDMTMIDHGKEMVSKLLRDIHVSTLRFNRIFLAKISIFKCVCLFILIFIILWILSGYF